MALECDNTYEYIKNLQSIEIYENTMNTALPQTELFNIITRHFDSALTDGKTRKKAIVLGYDGARADGIVYAAENGGINMLMSGGGHCRLSYCGGVNYPQPNTQASSTGPGWCSILTGKWGSETGVVENGIRKSNDYLTLLTTLVESGKAQGSSFIVSWDGHFVSFDSTYANEKEYCESRGLAVKFIKCDSDEETHKRTLDRVIMPDCDDFIFNVVECTDHEGHGSGFSTLNEKYQQAFATEDGYAAEVISAIKARATYDTEDWLIILTSDHGGFVKGHGDASVQSRMTFIVADRDF